MKKIMMILVVVLSYTTTSFAQKAAYTNASAAEFKTMMETKKGVVIDLRTPDEIKKGKIKGSQEIDFLAVDFAKEADKLDKKKIYYLYCAGGGRSSEAAEILISKGFKNVVNLQKGFSEWKKMNFEIEQK